MNDSIGPRERGVERLFYIHKSVAIETNKVFAAELLELHSVVAHNLDQPVMQAD